MKRRSVQQILSQLHWKCRKCSLFSERGDHVLHVFIYCVYLSHSELGPYPRGQSFNYLHFVITNAEIKAAKCPHVLGKKPGGVWVVFQHSRGLNALIGTVFSVASNT